MLKPHICCLGNPVHLLSVNRIRSCVETTWPFGSHETERSLPRILRFLSYRPSTLSKIVHSHTQARVAYRILISTLPATSAIAPISLIRHFLIPSNQILHHRSNWKTAATLNSCVLVLLTQATVSYHSLQSPWHSDTRPVVSQWLNGWTTSKLGCRRGDAGCSGGGRCMGES